MHEAPPILDDPHFWYGHFAGQFSITDPDRLNVDFLESALHVNDRDALAWWNTFTGFYEGVFDDSDGYVPNPGRLEVQLRNGVTIEVDYHPGGTNYWVRLGDVREVLGEMGPHWRLPALTLAELAGLAAGAVPALRRNHYEVLLLPLAWPDTSTDLDDATDHVAAAIARAEIADHKSARVIAEAWSGAFEGLALPDWSSGLDGVVTDAIHSQRGPTSDKSAGRRINAMIAAALSPDPRSSAVE